MPHRENRRTFLSTCARLTLGIPLAGSMLSCCPRNEAASLPPHIAASAPPLPRKEARRIVQIQSAQVMTGSGEIVADVLSAMLDAAVEKLTGIKGAEGWSALFSSDDVVAIKVNCLSGSRLSTHPGLVGAVVKKLKGIRIPEKNIFIYDRTSRELEAAGFSLNERGSGGPRCIGTDTRGVGYDGEPTVLGELGSCFSRIISEFCSAIINVPVLKDHDMCGITCSLKNHLGSIDNPNKCHPNAGDPFIAEVNTAPCIRDKSRLIICDGLEALYEGGPAYNPGGAWDFSGLLAATDPVAMDTLAWKLIEKRRKEKGLPSFKEENREPAYIKTAAQEPYNLGCGLLKEPGSPGDGVELITIKDSTP